MQLSYQKVANLNLRFHTAFKLTTVSMLLSREHSFCTACTGKNWACVKAYSKWNWKKCGRCGTISGYCFANCMNIFHKTEVQKVILRCLTGFYLIWFKSYDTKCSMSPNAILAKSETLHKNLQLTNGRFTTIFGHFLPTVWISFTKLKFRRSFLGA